MTKYVALLRGINVGGNNKIEMSKLRLLLESIGYSNVSTYLNSGNAIFESDELVDEVSDKINEAIIREFKLNIPVLVKSSNEMKRIADAIPSDWNNNDTHKTDVAYLFPHIDSSDVMDEVPIKSQFVDVRYIDGAIFWNISRADYNKSQINKLISHKIYKSMTMRNINTARYLGNL